MTPDVVSGPRRLFRAIQAYVQLIETLTPQVRVPEDIARKAKRAIDRMLELA